MREHLPAAIGQLLGRVRPGLGKTVYHELRLTGVPATIAVGSPAFRAGGELPERFTADGAGLSPPLVWSGVPAKASEIVIIVEDADSPTPAPLVHAIITRLPGDDDGIAEGALSDEHATLVTGRNSFLKTGWLPADPPPGHGAHRYAFQVFALGTPSGLSEHPERSAVVEALAGNTLAKGYLIGTYARC